MFILDILAYMIGAAIRGSQPVVLTDEDAQRADLIVGETIVEYLQRTPPGSKMDRSRIFGGLVGEVQMKLRKRRLRVPDALIRMVIRDALAARGFSESELG